jgi:anti-sigma B factor antagonist
MTNPQDTSATIQNSLRIEGEMNIYRAAELKGSLLEALEQAGELEIDLSAVSEIDTAGVQLLMLARKIAQEKQQSLRLVAHSPAVIEAFELLNLVAWFGDPLVMSSAGNSAHGRA